MIKLSGYKIIEKIGSGGMGDVYLAEHEKLEKKVAIKSLHNNLANDSNFRIRFSQEAKTHSKLDHPNIVRLLDYKEQKNGLFLIMEYFDGMQLDEYINKVSGPIPEKELSNLFCQILDAIGSAHEAGLVHRDIKPSNIMIDKKRKIKVLDFGIAKLQDEEQGLTKTGVQIGTASYMSPEQVNAEKLDKLSDIYSLGVTLFHMSVGKSPYNTETNSFKIQTQIINNELPKASDIYPGVSSKIEYIIAKSTKKDKSNRYQSCLDFKKDFLIDDVKFDVKSQDVLGSVKKAKENIFNGDQSQDNKDDNNLTKSETLSVKFPILIGMLVLFVSLGGYFYFSENDNFIFKSKNPKTQFQWQKTILTKKPTRVEFKEFLLSYYNTIEKQEYDNFDIFYNNNLNRWFNEDNILLEDIINKSKSYSSKFPIAKHLITWKTLKIANENGKYKLSYDLIYKCKKNKSDVWLEWNISINMILDDQMKIYSLEETKRKKVGFLSRLHKNKIKENVKQLESSKKIPLPSKREIYIQKFNKEPDYGNTVDVTSTYYSSNILYSRITEVFNEPSHVRYGKLNEGLSYANKMIQIDGDYWDYEQRAEINYFLGDYNSSLIDINIALEICKEKSNSITSYCPIYYLIFRAELHYMLGDLIEARKDIDKAFTLNALDLSSTEVNSKLYLLLGKVLNADGDYDEACRTFKMCKTDLANNYLSKYCNYSSNEN